jgi:DNA-binding transcriptional regulator YiaG
MNTAAPEYLKTHSGDIGRVLSIPSALGEGWVVVEQRHVTVTQTNWRLGLVEVTAAPEHPMDTIRRLREELAAAQDKACKSATVAELRSLSGLTTDQIARLFGVPGRKVHSWVAGATMAAQHHDRLHSLIARIRPLGATPKERRSHMLNSAEGASLLRQMTAEIPQAQVINAPALSVRERLCLPPRPGDLD